MIPKDRHATVARDPSREGKHIIIPTGRVRVVLECNYTNRGVYIHHSRRVGFRFRVRVR